jgi:hypothetical protein
MPAHVSPADNTYSRVVLHANDDNQNTRILCAPTQSFLQHVSCVSLNLPFPRFSTILSLSEDANGIQT